MLQQQHLEVGLKWGCLMCPHPVQRLNPLEPAPKPGRPNGQEKQGLCVPCTSCTPFASLRSWHSCSSFSDSNQNSLTFFLPLLAVHFFFFPFNSMKTTIQKLFLFSLKEGLLSTLSISVFSRKPIHGVFIFLWTAACYWETDGPFFMWFIGIPNECCQSDHVPELCVSLQPWASPSRSGIMWCLHRTQQSEFDFENSQLQLQSDGLTPWSNVGEHLNRCLAKVPSSEGFSYVLSWMLSRTAHLVPSHQSTLLKADMLT